MFKHYFRKVVFFSVLLVLIHFQNSLSQPFNLKDRFSVGMVGWVLDHRCLLCFNYQKECLLYKN